MEAKEEFPLAGNVVDPKAKELKASPLAGKTGQLEKVEPKQEE